MLLLLLLLHLVVRHLIYLLLPLLLLLLLPAGRLRAEALLRRRVLGTLGPLLKWVHRRCRLRMPAAVPPWLPLLLLLLWLRPVLLRRPRLPVFLVIRGQIDHRLGGRPLPPPVCRRLRRGCSQVQAQRSALPPAGTSLREGKKQRSSRGLLLPQTLRLGAFGCR